MNGTEAEGLTVVADAGMRLVTVGRTFGLLESVGRVVASMHRHPISTVAVQRLLALEVEARAASKPDRTQSGVAVIPLKGMITPNGMFSFLFGDEAGGGLNGFRSQLSAAASNPDVTSIVLDVDSPGGIVDLVPETAQEIADARATKPIVAVANTLTASAAYWLASQAHEVVITPSGEAGSVGVYQMHTDFSEMDKKDGIKVTFIKAGKHKAEMNPFEPLSEDAAAHAQEAVDDYYGQFVSDVARGRTVDKPALDGTAFGGARMFTAQAAVRNGLADRVATLDQTVKRLASGRAKVRRYDADADDPRASQQQGYAAFPPPQAGEDEGKPLSPEQKDRVLNVLAGLR